MWKRRITKTQCGAAGKALRAGNLVSAPYVAETAPYRKDEEIIPRPENPSWSAIGVFFSCRLSSSQRTTEISRWTGIVVGRKEWARIKSWSTYNIRFQTDISLESGKQPFPACLGREGGIRLSGTPALNDAMNHSEFHLVDSSAFLWTSEHLFDPMAANQTDRLPAHFYPCIVKIGQAMTRKVQHVMGRTFELVASHSNSTKGAGSSLYQFHLLEVRFQPVLSNGVRVLNPRDSLHGRQNREDDSGIEDTVTPRP
ncbi:uncharacterized protein EV420DRAFT_1473443 [Desarmillaria tabescens]|uniref:Uncharacterized protein n=1 Tax=Armillaria tabescens TaxID=1929756 RepID=A0AA39NRK7_ARMTA|nr:uncharacterized protein EV420DRAFT_1473443 [Desarmillaria tabescens]KAK0470390.1 hypothetical protein EV420DRAFT_1473443 [Desarmillaria tabescens]